MYLLDTNVVSELRRANNADAHVRTWAANVQLAELFLSTITVLEIERGILLIERRAPGSKSMFWPISPVASFRSMLPSPGDVHRSMFPTASPSAMP